MSYRLNYSEPLADVVQRLMEEHAEFRKKLKRIVDETDRGEIKVAISLLNLIKPLILRHAVEEEARLMRTIMHESRSESRESVQIMQEHRRITEFLEEKLPRLYELPPRRARMEIDEFIRELSSHHEEEERVVFPLALVSSNK
jgi:hemerythrin